MKKIKIYLSVSLITCTLLYAGDYPTNYSYGGYITVPARDQLAQGPCHTFATIACIEAMYKLYYGTTVDLSERALYNISLEDLSDVLENAETKGVIFEACNEYPDTPCHTDSREALQYVEIPDYDWIQDQIDCNKRFKITYDLVSGSTSNPDKIKSLLIQHGPMIVADGQHTMLLYGWEGNYFLFKDSGPCSTNIARKETISFFSSVAQIYIIDKVTKEDYNDYYGSWVPVNLNIKPFTLSENPADYPASLNKPSCFNLGTYSLDLINIPGAEITDWSVDNPGVTKSVSGDKKYCTLSGYGTNVNLTVVVERENGLLQKFKFSLGTVGVPSTVTVDKISAYCAGSNYEITTRISHPSVPGVSCSYNYDIPPLHNYSYVIESGRYAYWVFKAPETVTYTASVTYSKDGCSVTKSRNTYVYSLPCGGYYYKSGPEENTGEINNDENKLFIYPNPAGDKLTVHCIGEGMNNLSIYDINGRVVYSNIIESATEIDISGLSAGVYVVECYVENTEFLYRKEKLIIK